MKREAWVVEWQFSKRYDPEPREFWGSESQALARAKTLNGQVGSGKFTAKRYVPEPV